MTYKSPYGSILSMTGTEDDVDVDDGGADGGDQSTAPPEAMDTDLFRLCLILVVFLLIFYSLSGHFIEKFKILFIHESTVGVLTGALIQYILSEFTDLNDPIRFDSEGFFFYLLPPIVFASAYTIQKKNFIRNLSYIFGLGILGTIVAMIVISTVLLKMNPPAGEGKWCQQAEILLLASVLASTDTVAVLTLITADKYQVLNAVLFGEGVVNDAVCILLF